MNERQYRRLSTEFKLEAIRLAEESDKPVTQVARELGIHVEEANIEGKCLLRGRFDIVMRPARE